MMMMMMMMDMDMDMEERDEKVLATSSAHHCGIIPVTMAGTRL